MDAFNVNKGVRERFDTEYVAIISVTIDLCLIPFYLYILCFESLSHPYVDTKSTHDTLHHSRLCLHPNNDYTV